MLQPEFARHDPSPQVVSRNLPAPLPITFRSAGRCCQCRLKMLPLLPSEIVATLDSVLVLGLFGGSGLAS